MDAIFSGIALGAAQMLDPVALMLIVFGTIFGIVIGAGPPQPSFVASWQAACSAGVTAFLRSAHRIRRSRHHDSARAALFFAGFGAVPARRGIERFAPRFAPVRRGSGGLASAREGPYPACISRAH